MLKRLLGRILPQRSLPDKLSYEEAREILESHSHEMGKQLAQRDDVKPEMLYFLAEQESAEIRSLVATNPVTPIQANILLSADDDDEVRCQLALKIARILPGIDPSEAGRLREQTIEVLETLASDHLPRVRQIIAEEIKEDSDVPKQIVASLARDLEAIVAAPILEYSPLLADEDLLEIVASGAASEALEAIANREGVSELVSDAIVATLDVPAVAALLVNANAHIREETLDQIVKHADDIESWHQPLVMRPELSTRATKRVAGFVASSLITVLCERNDLDDQLVTELRGRVRERIQEEGSLSADSTQQTAAAKAAAASAREGGNLTAEYVVQAAEAGDRELVFESLALLAGVTGAVVRRIFDSRQGKAITAITWKSGLQMRVALKLQTYIGHVPPSDMILAREGVDYPLSAEEMEWHLSYFTRSA